MTSTEVPTRFTRTRRFPSYRKHFSVSGLGGYHGPLCGEGIGPETGSRVVMDIGGRLQRKLKWDPRTEQFVGDEEANRMLTRPMRAPWYL